MSIKRIKRFSIIQTSSMAGVLYFILTAVIMIPVGLIFSAIGMPSGNTFPFSGGMFFFIAPFIYGILGFVMVAIGCFVYNLVAEWIGGIEVEVVDVDQSPTAKSEPVEPSIE